MMSEITDKQLIDRTKSVAEDLINNSKQSDPEIDRLIYENIDELLIRDNE